MASDASIVGRTLGPYRIAAKIGAGGMGEVYRAVDTRLGRDVAIKILPHTVSRSVDRVRRFEQEARSTAALNHPNIVAIYDVGTQDGLTYIVTELLQGATLRQRMLPGRLPMRTTVNYALQVAQALAAAHDKRIIHRDLKPENVFVTNDGRVKVLDFGLAKLTGDEQLTGGDRASMLTETAPGMLLGTVEYMSPEQVRGQPLDHRTDLFSFGVMLYEMLTGKHTFARPTAADTLSAILKEEPPQLHLDDKIPASMEHVVRHCLEKNPEERFQSARDLAFDLELVATLPGSSALLLAAARSAPARLGRVARVALAGVLAVAMGATGVVLGKRLTRPEPPSYHQLTFYRGTVFSARFTHDANTIIYTAAWNGNPRELFSTRAEGTGTRAIGLKNAELLSLSSTGEMAVLINRRGSEFASIGTLARVPLEGGTPRAVSENVTEADWSADGAHLVAAEYVPPAGSSVPETGPVAGGRERIEYEGKTLYQTSGWVTNMRFSPNGNRIAFLDHPLQWDGRGWVTVVSLDGRKQRLTSEFSDAGGLAWSPDGDEVWFSGTISGEDYALYAVNMSGKQRLVLRVPTNVMLYDISRSGAVLLASYRFSTPILAKSPGREREGELSTLNGAGLSDLSDDGKLVVLQYYGEGSGMNYATYLAPTDGSPLVRLGEGAGKELSPDKQWVLTKLGTPRETVLLPTGVGQVRQLTRPNVEDAGDDAWFPDSHHVVFTGQEAGKPVRCYMQDIAGGPPKPVSPEGTTGNLVSPDGKFLLIKTTAGAYLVILLGTSETREIHGLSQGDTILRWAADSKHFLLYRPNDTPTRIYRLDITQGQRELIKEIIPPDPAGVVRSPLVEVSPDGKWYAYQLQRYLSDLYLVQGLDHN